MSSRIFIIYDGRACGDRETDDAAILFNVGGDRQEAIDYMVEDNFGQCALYSYNEEGATSLTDERWEGDFIPGKGWLPNPQDQAASRSTASDCWADFARLKQGKQMSKKHELMVTGVHLMSSKYDKHRLLKGEIEFSNGEKTIEIALTDEQSRKLMLSLAVFLSESANEIANSIRDAFCLPNPQDQKEDDK